MNPAVAERRTVSAAAVLPASPDRIFDILTDITQHPVLDGSGMLCGAPEGPRRLALGSEFTMGMRQAGMGYRSFSGVVEFEEGRRIAWESMELWRGRKIVGGQRWRWTLRSIEDGSRVVHSYVWGYASWPLAAAASTARTM